VLAESERAHGRLETPPPAALAATWRPRLGVADPIARVSLDALGDVVGFACAGVPGALLALHVRPDVEGHGHGSGLLAAALDDLAGLGYDDVYTELGPGRERGRRFLVARGWRPVADERLGRSVAGFRRRWDIDARGTGVADGADLVPAVDALRSALLAPGWVAEEPEQHLLPHLRRLCDAQGWKVQRAVVDRAELTVDVAVPRADWRMLRIAAYSLLGTFAEPATFIRQEERDDEGLTLVAATGVLEGDSSFAPHGHTVRLHVTPT